MNPKPKMTTRPTRRTTATSMTTRMTKRERKFGKKASFEYKDE